MYFVNTFDVCVKHYSKKFPKLKVYLSCFGALYICHYSGQVENAKVRKPKYGN